MEPLTQVCTEHTALCSLTNAVPEFKAFPKIARLSRPVVITEKIDGTNGAIWVSDDSRHLMAGSRNRWVSPGKTTDNYGFAQWVHEHQSVLATVLGPGLHHGEWWGAGIARKYGLDHKRFSLFNPKFYEGAAQAREQTGLQLYIVPILGHGDDLDSGFISMTMRMLIANGSYAAPGFMDPEGIVIYHTANGVLFKKTIKGDEKPKGSTE